MFRLAVERRDPVARQVPTVRSQVSPPWSLNSGELPLRYLYMWLVLVHVTAHHLKQQGHRHLSLQSEIQGTKVLPQFTVSLRARRALASRLFDGLFLLHLHW